MKYLLLIASAFILISCSNNEKETETPDPEQANEATEKADEVEGSFRGGNITYNKNYAQVEGSAKTTNDKFYYHVEQEGEIIVEETKVTLDETEDGWGEYKIGLDLTDDMYEREEYPVFVLYVKASDNTKVNPTYIPIDLQLSQY